MKPTIELASTQFNPADAFPENVTEWITKKAKETVHAAADKFNELNLNEQDYLIDFKSSTRRLNITVTATAFDASDLDSSHGTVMTVSEAKNY